MYVPSGYHASTPIALVLGFHGAGDTGTNFYQICMAYGWNSAAGPANFILLVPNTKSPFSDFANWTGNPSRDINAMKNEMSEILAIVAEVKTHYNIDAKQVHAFGFSNGGLFTAIGGFASSQSLASLTVMGYGWGSSYPAGVRPTRKLGVQLICGTQDSFASMAQSSASYLSSNGHSAVYRSAANAGHRFSSLLAQHSASTLFAWMKSHPLP
jgi:poly(3-hydroxybutyrate) depolymerase